MISFRCHYSYYLFLSMWQRHTFAVLAILKGMPLETLQKVLGHNSILSTQVYAELINPKVSEDTDKLCEKIGHVYKLAV